MTLASLAVITRRAPRRAVVASATLGIVFLVLAILVALGTTRSADLAVTRGLHTIASSPLDAVVNAHTVVGQLAITLPVSMALAIAAQRRLGGYAWIGALFILATGGIELVFKNLAAHPGPAQEFTRAFGNPLGIPREVREAVAPFAFPSGQMARLTFLTVVAVSLSPSRFAIGVGAAFVWFSLFARVYIGDHWISDSLGGVALGASVAFAAVAWMRATARR